jgi:hypothetical protein
MRGAPLRIEPLENQTGLNADGTGGEVGKLGGAGWTEAVTKLIPGEVVAAYLAGKLVLPPNNIFVWLVWTGVCTLGVVLFRRWMTSDSKAGVPPEWSAVIISAVSFLVWVYSFGDVFKMLGYWSAEDSTRVLIAWTLASPVFMLGLKGLHGSTVRTPSRSHRPNDPAGERR